MVCGSTYTPEQAELASRTRTSLRHPHLDTTLSEQKMAIRSMVLQEALKSSEFESRGERDLPRLQIFKNDKTTIDKNCDVLIWRPMADGIGGMPPIGITFAHSLKHGAYKGFNLAKVRSVQSQILDGKLSGFHFVTSESFPADIRRAILAANEELRAKEIPDDHLINFHSDQEYPFPF